MISKVIVKSITKIITGLEFCRAMISRPMWEGGMRRIMVAGVLALAATSAPAQMAVREVPRSGGTIPDTGTALRLDLYPGTQGIVQVDATFSQVLIGNVAIADALPKSDTMIVVQGKVAGFTDMLIMKGDKLLTKVAIVVNPPAANRGTNRVFAHSPSRDIHEYTAYECNPVCTRVFDPFERRGGGGQGRANPPIIIIPVEMGARSDGQAGGGGMQVVVPPPQ